MPSPVPILTYHSISQMATPSFRRWTVSPERFAEHMAYLADSSYTTMTFAEYARMRSSDAQLPVNPIVLTFDDGFADFMSAALPQLAEHGHRATLFVTSGYVGGTSEWLIRERETYRPMITWEDLAGLPEQIELGGHGFSHRQLDTMPSEEALADVAAGLALLADRTGRTIETLAYPHGYSTRAIERGLPEMGLSGACGVADAIASPDDSSFRVPRLMVDDPTGVDDLHRMLTGSGVRVGAPQKSWQQGVWRGWRRMRLRVGVDKVHVP